MSESDILGDFKSWREQVHAERGLPSMFVHEHVTVPKAMVDELIAVYNAANAMRDAEMGIIAMPESVKRLVKALDKINTRFANAAAAVEVE